MEVQIYTITSRKNYRQVSSFRDGAVWWTIKQVEEQQSLLCLQEAAEAHYVEHAAQKARKETEAKAKEKAKKQRIVEKKKKKLEYIQRLWDEVIAEDNTLLKGTEGSQVTWSKHKKVFSRDKEGHQPSKKAKEKYCSDNIVKMGDANPCERCVHARQDCLVHYSR